MNTINCLIVDDEPVAQEIVKTYCGHLPQLHVVACCDNAIAAKTVLQQEQIDLMFLDINMPVLSGLAFLKTLSRPPQVIFTTAYKEYALDAFDLAACDYLLKPFSFERFMVAVDKAIARLQPAPVVMPASTESTPVAGVSASTPVPSSEQSGHPTTDYLFIKADGKIFRVLHDDILFATANGNYTKVVTKQQVLLPAMTFSSFEEQLPKTEFLRVHRSFLINKAKISHIEGNVVYVEKHEIPIGSNYKEDFLKKIGF
jgi:two-component system, LytTR family, response regulator